jgi:hypothetical protein
VLIVKGMEKPNEQTHREVEGRHPEECKVSSGGSDERRTTSRPRII